MRPRLRRAWILELMTLLLTTALVPCPAQAQVGTGTVRVAPSGTNQVGCGSVASPCRTLQFAVEQFDLGSTGAVHVAAGTYVESQPREVVRVTGRELMILGGYTTAFTDRDASVNVVTIDGENARRGVTVEFNASHTTSLALHGVTVRQGVAPNELVGGTLNHFGGGLDAASTTLDFPVALDLVEVRFLDNVAEGADASTGLPGNAGGGGLSLRNVTATLTDVEFTRNTARGGDGTGGAKRGGLGVGGGIFTSGSSVTVHGATASDNEALGGDALSSDGSDDGEVRSQRADGLGGFWAWIQSSGQASDVTAVGNQAQGGQAAKLGGLGLGGALFIEDATAPVTLDRFAARSNTALGAGGGSTGGLGGGGGVFCTDSQLEIAASTIVSNLAEGGSGTTNGGDGAGGGIYMDSVLPQTTSLDATNVIIGDNAGVAGSGPTPGFAFGGGLFQQSPSPTGQNDTLLTHVTLAENAVTGGSFNQGAALWVGKEATSNSSYAVITDHTTPPVPMKDRGETVLTYGTADFDTTLWNGNTTCADFCPIFVVPPDDSFPGGSSTNTNPVSGSPDYVAPDGNPPDYHIQATSAAAERAVDSTTLADIDGEPRPRPLDSVPDLGADEVEVPEPGAALAGCTALVMVRTLAERRRRRARQAAEECRLKASSRVG